MKKKLKVVDIVEEVLKAETKEEKIRILKINKKFLPFRIAMEINYSDTDFLHGLDLSDYKGVAPVSLPSQKEIFLMAIEIKKLFDENKIKWYFDIIDKKDAELVKTVLKKKLDLGISKEEIFLI